MGEQVDPFDILNKKNHTTQEEHDRRYEICKGCEFLFKPSRTCKKCYCFMPLKSWLEKADCPIGKWDE